MTMKLRKFQFNTGRTYTPLGQIIVVEIVGDKVSFTDLNRALSCSFFLYPNLVTKSDTEIAQMVMAAYDADDGLTYLTADEGPQYDPALPTPLWRPTYWGAR